MKSMKGKNGNPYFCFCLCFLSFMLFMLFMVKNPILSAFLPTMGRNRNSFYQA